MSLIHDPARVDAEIERLVGLLEAATDEYAKLAREEAEARARRDIGRAKAYFLAEGTIPEREAAALLAVEEDELAYRRAEALADAQREKLRSLREQLGALRTISANLREVST